MAAPAGSGAAPAAAQSDTVENQVKAAFVAKFAGFVEWPPEALDGRKTLDICVARPSPFGEALSELVSGETAHGRPLAAREVSSVQAVEGCQVLFLPALPAGARDAYLSRARAVSALTVGDDEGFIEHGGIILLRTVNGRVRFEINAEGARDAKLRLSSQLMRLAVTVHGGPS